METLGDLREQIDQIDSEIIDLLAMRFVITNKIGALKVKNKLEAQDKSREQEIVYRLKKRAEKTDLDSKLVEAVYGLIMAKVVANHKLMCK